MDPRLLMQILQSRSTQPGLSQTTTGPSPLPTPSLMDLQTAPNAPVPPPPPPRGPNFFDKMFGGPTSMLLGPDARKGAQSQALLRAGLSLLASGGRRVGPNNLGENLLGALQAGTDAYGGAVTQNMGVAQYAEQMQKKAAREAVFRRFGVGPDASPQQTLDGLQRALPYLVQLGDPAVGSIVELLKSQHNKYAKVGEGEQLVDPATGQVIATGGPKQDIIEVRSGNYVLGVDKRTGQEVWRKPRPVGEGEGNTQRFGAMIANQVLGDLQTNTSAQRAAASGYAALIGAADSASTNQESALGLMYALAKVLDPASAVREGELATLQKQGSVDRRVQNWVNAASKGTLTPAMVTDIKKLAASLMAQHKATYEDYLNAANLRASSFGIDISKYAPNPFRRFGLDSQAPGKPDAVAKVDQTLGRN